MLVRAADGHISGLEDDDVAVHVVSRVVDLSRSSAKTQPTKVEIYPHGNLAGLDSIQPWDSLGARLHSVDGRIVDTCSCSCLDKASSPSFLSSAVASRPVDPSNRTKERFVNNVDAGKGLEKGVGGSPRTWIGLSIAH